MKAIYVSRGWTFRYTHDLEELFTNLRAKGVSALDQVLEAVILTGYAFEARYPGMGDPILEGEYEEALALAEGVVSWAEGQVHNKNP